MRFLFVDKITATDGNVIRGLRHFGVDEPLRYHHVEGSTMPAGEVSPGAVSEAVGQLASWYCLEKNGFSARPVFLFADRIAMPAATPVGAQVDLAATIHELDTQTFRFSGEARVGGTLVHQIDMCSGYFMPLAELEDPQTTKSRYEALTHGGLKLDGHGGAPYGFDALAGETVETSVQENGLPMIRTRQTMAIQEPFYKDHFPRFPVTPIVMLTEMLAAATARLVGADAAGKRLRGREARGLKIRSFVKPGETVEAVVRLKAPAPGDGRGGVTVETAAELLKDGKPILRGNYVYELLG
jgi:3-hydroxymyristoyl/3-hydroxydecanoyl-(acyl carrier protein) dehydratase